MHIFLMVLYLLVVIILVGVILLQKSEGGGFRTSTNSSSFMASRGSKNALSRLTAILATIFFASAIILVVLDSRSNSASDILKRLEHNKIDKTKALEVPSNIPNPSNQPDKKLNASDKQKEVAQPDKNHVVIEEKHQEKNKVVVPQNHKKLEQSAK